MRAWVLGKRGLYARPKGFEAYIRKQGTKLYQNHDVVEKTFLWKMVTNVLMPVLLMSGMNRCS